MKDCVTKTDMKRQIPIHETNKTNSTGFIFGGSRKERGQKLHRIGIRETVVFQNTRCQVDVYTSSFVGQQTGYLQIVKRRRWFGDVQMWRQGNLFLDGRGQQ
jgi:hypothetical protein